MISKFKNVMKRIGQNIDIRIKNFGNEKNNKYGEIVILNTALNSDNLGDEIIFYYYSKAIKDVISPNTLYNVATHNYPNNLDIEKLLNSKYSILIGTNILSPQMELYSGWKFNNKLIKMRNVVLVGVGCWGYKKPSIYSKYVYRNILSKEIIHSVRDNQTMLFLKSMGINNVINTNCLTMLGLDEISKNIPCKKADNVIFTLTGVMNRKKYDKQMIEILRKNYKKLYFWPQGDIDLKYLNDIQENHDINILEQTFEAYTNFLKNNNNFDYVGTRLHGGIHAMQNGYRSIIIAIDNRAVEISKDTNLPIIKDSEINTKLTDMITSEWVTKIKLNNSEIEKWKSSFRNILK
ncbi:polysaccharide pyruvyl transferase family protein [Enterococcus cecorum]|uniref:polysaccharide pyruvyl transferase family protein n=1 Tax=Enterococcus cecorum TaxID=44008 RepID=UPI00200A829D|nr:polysaccharide pyruvyl transferase family protein [Enterococcus cecorum]